MCVHAHMHERNAECHARMHTCRAMHECTHVVPGVDDPNRINQYCRDNSRQRCRQHFLCSAQTLREQKCQNKRKTWLNRETNKLLYTCQLGNHGRNTQWAAFAMPHWWWEIPCVCAHAATCMHHTEVLMHTTDRTTESLLDPQACYE